MPPPSKKPVLESVLINSFRDQVKMMFRRQHLSIKGNYFNNYLFKEIKF